MEHYKRELLAIACMITAWVLISLATIDIVIFDRDSILIPFEVYGAMGLAIAAFISMSHKL